VLNLLMVLFLVRLPLLLTLLPRSSGRCTLCFELLLALLLWLYRYSFLGLHLLALQLAPLLIKYLTSDILQYVDDIRGWLYSSVGPAEEKLSPSCCPRGCLYVSPSHLQGRLSVTCHPLRRGGSEVGQSGSESGAVASMPSDASAGPELFVPA
jgi:hypothetical protein